MDQTIQTIEIPSGKEERGQTKGSEIFSGGVCSNGSQKKKGEGKKRNKKKRGIGQTTKTYIPERPRQQRKEKKPTQTQQGLTNTHATKKEKKTIGF